MERRKTWESSSDVRKYLLSLNNVKEMRAFWMLVEMLLVSEVFLGIFH